jgi:hypothetical protein
VEGLRDQKWASFDVYARRHRPVSGISSLKAE